ncbi:hypothetical protein EDC01DRAFT_645761 [Geopyxis carbonaria]|nr:hypothetical protein EDC01DRAFT_645761 [Geopyxis carbonaria]
MLYTTPQFRLVCRNQSLLINKRLYPRQRVIGGGIHTYSQAATEDRSLPPFELTDYRLAWEALLVDPSSRIPESLDELVSKATAPRSKWNHTGDGWTGKDAAFLKMRFFDRVPTRCIVPEKFIPTKETDKLYRKLAEDISELSQKEINNYRNLPEENFDYKKSVFKEVFLWISRCRGLFAPGDRRGARQGHYQPSQKNPLETSQMVVGTFLETLLKEVQAEPLPGKPRFELRCEQIPIAWKMGDRTFQALADDALCIGGMHPKNMVMTIVTDLKEPYPAGTKHTPQNPPVPFVSSRVRSHLCAHLLAQAASRSELKASPDQIAFVAHLQGMSLTIVAAEFSRNYLDTLKRTGEAVEEIIVRRSEVFNFRHKKDRERAVRAFMGLFRWFADGNPNVAPLQAVKALAVATAQKPQVGKREENADTLDIHDEK